MSYKKGLLMRPFFFVMCINETVTICALEGANVTEVQQFVTICAQKGTNVTELLKTVTTWVGEEQRQKKILIFVEVKISGAG